MTDEGPVPFQILLKNKRTKLWLRTALLTVSAFLLSSCMSHVMQADHAQQLLKNDEFDNAIKVQDINAPVEAKLAPSGRYVELPGPTPIEWPKKPSKYARHGKHRLVKEPEVAASSPAPAASEPATPAGPKPHEPSLEDGEGFDARRPMKDPYRVGEKVTLEVSYFGVSAGEFTVEVRPFVQVNGHKSYTFAGTARTTSVFAVFYAVDDWFETFVDYESMAPSSYQLHVKETKQLRETRAVFDWVKGLATWWDKKIDSEQKVEERKKEWSIPLYSQNVFSIPFYLRAFTLTPGKKLSFVVAHESENLTVTAEVLRKEHISIEAGEFDTVVVKPKIELNGVFKPVGDILIWLTDDDRKFIVRIESKIKIGTIVGVAKKIEP